MATWSGIRKKLETEYLAQSLQGHIQYYATSYSRSHDHEGRAAFHLDQEMSTIREEITNAQRLNEIRRKMTSNILDNIRKLHFMLSLEDMSAINKEFSDVWNSNDIDKLREFNERLNVLVEVYRI